MRSAIGMTLLIAVTVPAGCLLQIDRGLIAETPTDASVPTIDGRTDDSSGPDGGASGGLVGSWMFDDAVGLIAVDGSGHAHDATLSGGARFDDAGTRGGCVAFVDGGVVAMSDLNGPAFPRSGTLSLWFKYTFAIDDPEQRSVLDVWEVGRAHLLMRRAPGAAPKTFQVAWQLGDGTFAFATSFETEKATWSHVVLSWDGATGAAAVYLNDVRVRGLTLSPPFVPDGQLLRLGVKFEGAIDEVRLYDHALTASEVLKLR